MPSGCPPITIFAQRVLSICWSRKFHHSTLDRCSSTQSGKVHVRMSCRTSSVTRYIHSTHVSTSPSGWFTILLLPKIALSIFNCVVLNAASRLPVITQELQPYSAVGVTTVLKSFSRKRIGIILSVNSCQKILNLPQAFCIL